MTDLPGPTTSGTPSRQERGESGGPCHPAEECLRAVAKAIAVTRGGSHAQAEAAVRAFLSFRDIPNGFTEPDSLRGHLGNSIGVIEDLENLSPREMRIMGCIAFLDELRQQVT